MLKTETEQNLLLDSQKADIEAFLREMRVNGSAEWTVENYRRTLMKFARFCRKPFKETTKEDVLRFIEKVQKEAAETTVNLRKIHLKRFYRWLYGMERGDYPPQVKSLKAKPTRGKITRDELLTDEELKEIIRHAGNSRNRALIAVLFETAARPSELLSLNVGSVEAKEYGFMLYIKESKTKVRNLPVIQTASYLARWLEDHPFRQNPNAPLWINLSRNGYGKRLEYIGLLKLLHDAAKRAGIKKRFSPRWLRHLRLTHLATQITEQTLKNFAGWTPESAMPRVYIHLNGKDVENAILKASGVKVEEKPPQRVFEPRICPRCGTENPDTAIYCGKCGTPLTIPMALATKSVPIDEVKRLREEVNNLRRLIIQTANIPLDFLQKAFLEYQRQKEVEEQKQLEKEREEILKK